MTDAMLLSFPHLATLWYLCVVFAPLVYATTLLLAVALALRIVFGKRLSTPREEKCDDRSDCT